MDDILLHIFSFMSKHNRNIYLVSKQWNHIYNIAITIYPIHINIRANIPAIILRNYKNTYSLNIFNSLLTSIPDELYGVKILNISFCKNMNHIPKFKYLKKLYMVHTNITSDQLEIASEEILNKLEVLSIQGCEHIHSLPKFTNLIDLNISYSGVYNYELKKLKLSSLKRLDIKGCKWIYNIPFKFECLEFLDISDTNIWGSIFNTSFAKLDTLKELSINSCYNIRNIPAFKCLEILDMGSTFVKGNKLIPFAKTLKKLDIRFCHCKIILPKFERLEILNK